MQQQPRSRRGLRQQRRELAGIERNLFGGRQEIVGIGAVEDQKLRPPSDNW